MLYQQLLGGHLNLCVVQTSKCSELDHVKLGIQNAGKKP